MFVLNDDFKFYVLPWISLLITGFIAWSFHTHIYCSIKNKWARRKLIREKQKERDLAFQKLEQKFSELTDKAKKIVNMTEDQLILELQQRKLSALEVLEAFVTKALKETREFNSVTEFIPQASLWAKRLDERVGLKGPLHGLPISIKDNISLEGTSSTMGFSKNVQKPSDQTCLLVKMLMDLGAVPFCKTNVPQSLFSWGCGNPLFGDTKNCLHPRLSPGGSSGGEGSLIGSGASLFGIGTDAGGSVRIPAHFCGICSLKPTKMRLSPHGLHSSAANIIGLSGVAGFMGKSTAIINIVFNLLTAENFQNKYDMLTVPIPWNENMFSNKRSINIGYYTSLEFFPLIGDTQDVILYAKQCLESAGHNLIPIKPPDSFKMMELFVDLAYADGGEFVCKLWKDEPVSQAAIFHYCLSRIPSWIKKILAAIMDSRIFPFFHSPRVATMFRGGAKKSKDLMLAMEERKKLLHQFTKEWECNNLNVILCPAFPFPAVPINFAGYLKPAIIYTVIYNIFDWPAGVIPFGCETGKKLDEFNTKGDFLLKWAHQAAKESIGMPISVQIVGMPFHEENVLRVMTELENLRKL